VILSAGDRIDRYEVVDLLGSGGMGEVYRARDPKLERHVALKVLRLQRESGSEGGQRLLREARAVARLSHPNIVAVHDVGEATEPESARGLAYIAMELVVGRSLRACIGDQSIGIDRRVGWLRDVARGLGAAHDAGIIHRDVKPENVMIRADGVVKVLDFGIARRLQVPISGDSAGYAGAGGDPSRITAHGVVVGTPLYMAPEQLRGEPLDGRADQFAWGALAYELLTGASPWGTAVDTTVLISRILTLDPPPPMELDARIPRSASNVVMRALAKKAANRFYSFPALLAELDGASISSTSLDAAPPLRTERIRVRSPVFVRRVVAAAALGVSTFLAVAVIRVPKKFSQGEASAPHAAPASECRVNADCTRAHGGGASHCHSQRHVCVEIGSVDCKAYAEPHDAEADDVVWLGGMFPLSNESDFIDEMRAADLARRDFAQVLGPSSARPGPLHARPIALAICDENVDPGRAAKHLVEDVEAPAVIGFRSNEIALNVIPTELLPNHVLSFVTIDQATDVTRIPEPVNEPRLVWRSTLDQKDYARAIARFISDFLEPAARSSGLGARPLKVATVWPKMSNHSFVDTLFGVLRFNSRSALDNGGSFRQFIVESDENGPDQSLVEALLSFAPGVIVFGGDDFTRSLLGPLEARWGRDRRPTYLTASGFGSDATAFAGRDATKRHRFFSITNLSTTMPNAKLVLRYNQAYPREPVVRSDAPQPSYDAFYVLAYATYALGDVAISGPALSLAIDHLVPPAPPVDVGPAGIYDAFATLRAGGGIDLNGAIGSLDFDRATGEAPIDYSITCFDIDDRGSAGPSIDSGLTYDSRSDKLVGVLQCP
jgi:tRNA A-37 threonylcarbamoyl transferase component Bud32